MATVTVLPLGTYAAGNRLIGPVSVPNGIATVAFAIQRCTSADNTIWSDPNTTISLNWDCSVDGGVTWINLGGFSGNGGIALGRGGVELAWSSGSVQFPTGTGRQVRVNSSIVGGSVKTSVTLTTS